MRVNWRVIVISGALLACAESDPTSGSGSDLGASEVATSDFGSVDAPSEGDVDGGTPDTNVTVSDIEDSSTNDAVVESDVPEDDVPDVSPPPAGLCAPAGTALVRKLEAGEKLEGPESLGGEGDWLIANDVAAFVIQRPGGDKTYYYYGGLPIDAAPMKALPEGGCEQTGPETFGEVAFAVGRLNIAAFAESTLRGFRGDAVEIVEDGSDGGAVVLRVTGSDQPFWLVEYELIRRLASSGQTKAFSSPEEVELAMEYTLVPGDPVLRMDLRITNKTQVAREMLAGIVAFVGDSTKTETSPIGALDLGGFGLKTSTPWLGAFGATSWALGSIASDLGTVSISGADVLLDLGQIGAPLQMGPAGNEDTATQTWFLAVAAGGTDTPAALLQPHLGEPQQIDFVPMTGIVTIEGTSDPVAGARVEVIRPGPGNGFVPVVTTTTGIDGHYSILAPVLADAVFRVTKVGWPSSDETPIPTPPATLDASMGRPGRVAYDVKDGDGTSVPARIRFYSGGAKVRQVYGLGVPGEVELPPGEYDVVVSRGYEYTTVEETLVVAAGEATLLVVILSHVVDPTGYLSFDGHVHAGPSGDSTIPLVERVQSAAADGLEVIGHTDHEILVDPEPARLASGVANWLGSMPGEELTATTPEHMSVWDLPPDPTHARGRPIVWFQKDLPTLFAEAKARGGIVALNHPRTSEGCAYLCLIDWDRIAGAPGLTDPTFVGLPADAELWGWDFDALELYNSFKNLFALGKDKKAGIFDDWMSFLNHGHRITAVASTDEHGDGGIGMPRTYFASSTDDPKLFNKADFRTAIANGDVTLSAGAFAIARVGTSGPGKTVAATGGKVTLSIDVRALATIDVSRISVFVNCDEVLKIPATDPHGVQKYLGDVILDMPVDAHVVVVAFGKDAMPSAFFNMDPKRVPRALVNPIYVDADGDGSWTAPGGKTCTYTLD